MLNDILTLHQQWLPNQSDFPPISWPWYRLWPSPNYEWFPWSICNGCGVLAGNAYPCGHLVPSPHFGTCLCSNCWDQIPRTCQVTYLLDFSSLGTFSILLNILFKSFFCKMSIYTVYFFICNVHFVYILKLIIHSIMPNVNGILYFTLL